MNGNNLRNLSRYGIVLLLLLLSVVAVAPLLRSDSPCSHDGAFHYYRVTAMRHALQTSGILYTRFLPDLAFGYGYPFFNYRAASSYYLALILHMLGLTLPVALNQVYVLSIIGSALAAYLLGRDLFGPAAGLIAAVAYAYAPYQFLDALLRANAPESLALPLMPLILWAFRRLALTGQRRWFVASVVSLFALYMTHNISSLLFTPYLMAYLFVLWVVYRRENHFRSQSQFQAQFQVQFQGTAIVALVFALGLAAFYFGPALLEQDYAQLHMSHVTRNNDFHYNFLPLSEILAPPRPVDTALLNPPMRIHLGLGQALLATIGLIVGGVRCRKGQGADRERRATLAFLALTAVLLIWLSTSSSLWVWEHVPLLPFVQFPWRLVGRAALPVALLAGAVAPPSTRPAGRSIRRADLLTVAIVLLLIVLAFPATYPPRGYCINPPHPTITDVFAYEHRSKLVGVDPEGSYFPAWVQRRPEGSPLEAQYAAGGPVRRFDETTLPAEATLLAAEYGPNRAEFVIETPIPFRARYLAFYFPGWRVLVDGDPIPIAPTDPDGLIAFDVPAGHHTITVRFGETPLRRAADAVSVAFLVALVAFLIRYPVRRPTSPSDEETPSPLTRMTFLALLTTLVVVVGVKLGIVDRRETIFRHPSLSSDGKLSAVSHLLNQPYADGMKLIGFNLDREVIPADGVLNLDLYWTTYAPPTARYQSIAHLVGADGLRWSLADTARPRGYADYPPHPAWPAGHYALDSHEISPLSGTPPGTYDLVLTIFDRETLAPLSVLNDAGQPSAPELTIGRVTLLSPTHPSIPDSAGAGLSASLPPLTILDAHFDRTEAAPGGHVLVTTFWQADRRPEADLTVRLTLRAFDGTPAVEYELPPSAPWYPTSRWQPGDVWRGQRILHLPATLESGDYTWTLALGTHPTIELGGLRVTAPPHIFTIPPVEIETHTRLDDVATLIGATLHPADLRIGTPVTVTLVWRAEATPDESYRVFVHLLDPTGRIVAQSDGIPAGWTRPTTGWIPGEIITDVHTLTLPDSAANAAGPLTLLVGLYTQETGRLTTPDGQDAILITTLTPGGTE